MSWLRVDDSYPDHPKVARLSDPAFRAHVRCMAYCARHLTDGYIPKRIAEDYAGPNLADLTKKPRTGEALLLADGDDYLVHDYLVYNPTREKVMAERKRTAERVTRHRNAGGNGSSNGVTDGVSNPVSTDAPYPYPSLGSETPTPKTSSLSPNGVDPSVLAYFEGKLRRDATDKEIASLRTLCRNYEPNVVSYAIGQACSQSESADNFALVTTIAKKVSA